MKRGSFTMKRMVVAAALLAAVPFGAQAQSPLQPGGFYIGAEGGANWLLNSTFNSTLTVPGARSAPPPPARPLPGTPASSPVAASATISSALASRPKASIARTPARCRSVDCPARPVSTSIKSPSWGTSSTTSSPDRRSSPMSAPAPVSRSSTRALSARRRLARSSPIRASSAWAGTSTRRSVSTWKAVTTARRLPTSRIGHLGGLRAIR